MSQITIPSYKSCEYFQVWKITQRKDGYVWKTKPLGHIHRSEKDKFPHSEYVLSSVSTNKTKDSECTLDMF